jgi:hypothetical protein
MGLRDRLAKALAPTETPEATFFDTAEPEAIAKPAKARKARGKSKAEQRAEEACAQVEREPLQQNVEAPGVAVARMLAAAEGRQIEAQPTSVDKPASFRRIGRGAIGSVFNSLGLRSNGPFALSTHPNEYELLQSQQIAAERAAAKEHQERRALRGLDWLAEILNR